MKELVKMSLAYPMNKQTVEELEIIAEIWMESLVNISADVFKDATRLHREASNFYPTVKEILECCNSVWEARRRDIKKLPEPIPDLTPEQIKENVQRVRDVMGTFDPEQAVIQHRLKNINEKDLKKRVKERLEKYKDGEKKGGSKNNGQENKRARR